jgi:pilus assembly protein CpaF
LDALGCLAGLEPSHVRIQAAAALDAVIHVRRDGPVRRVTEVAAVARAPDRAMDLISVLRADPDDPAAPGVRGPGWPLLAERFGLPA